MKTITAYEYKDLDKETKMSVFNEWLNDRVDFELDCLSNDINDGAITEEEYYTTLGCDKHYAETTSWFVPSCYYDKHKVHLHKIVKYELSHALFTPEGRYITGR